MKGEPIFYLDPSDRYLYFCPKCGFKARVWSIRYKSTDLYVAHYCLKCNLAFDVYPDFFEDYKELPEYGQWISDEEK